MNGFIIDTHIFLWLIFDPKKIDKKQLQILENPQNDIFITSISFWEISIKYNLKKLRLNNLTPELLPKIAKDMDIEILNIDENTMSSFYKLPKSKIHKDPFDRLIVWKCICDNFTLISQDSKLYEYKNLHIIT